MHDPSFDSMRNTGWRGGGIDEHRAFRSLPYRPAALPGLVLLATGLATTLAFCYQPLANAWVWTVDFWLERLAMPAEILRQPFEVPLLGDIGLLSIALPASPPSRGEWALNLAAVTAGLGVSALLPESALPLRYLLRLVAGVHCISLLYFALAAEHFPYGIGDHTASLYSFAVVLIALLPWLLAATYYIFENSWRRRLAASALVIGYFIVALPFKLLAHAALIDLLSPLAMPVLYLFFGAPFDILMLVALYSWIISWD